VIFVGVDWAEDHHDVCVMDLEGTVLGKRRVPDSISGVGDLHEIVSAHAQDAENVVVGIKIDRGLVVTALVAADYEVFAINPMASSRYRDRDAVSGAKSDARDAKVLADLVRTDRHNHRPVAGDSSLVDEVKILARAHQSAIWGRQRQVKAIRSALREYYPAALAAFGTDLSHSDAIAVLAVAPTPELGGQLSRSSPRRCAKAVGRATLNAAPGRSKQRFAPSISRRRRSSPRPTGRPPAPRFGSSRASRLRSVHSKRRSRSILSNTRTRRSSAPWQDWERILGDRVLGESGDDRTRFAGPKCRKNYAGTSPITKSSGRSHVVLARFARNRRLADALNQWAFGSLKSSPGARRYYHKLRARGKTHRQAVRQLANRWVGILHTCLQQDELYDEQTAWPSEKSVAA
jgi:hypothetical protein